MQSVLFYIVPILIYVMVNNSVASLDWPHLLVLLLSFLMFQLARVRYPKGNVPLYAKMTQTVFYVATVAFLFRDQYVNALIINLLLGATSVLVLIEILKNRKKPSN